jgi:hypothetical protein
MGRWSSCGISTRCQTEASVAHFVDLHTDTLELPDSSANGSRVRPDYRGRLRGSREGCRHFSSVYGGACTIPRPAFFPGSVLHRNDFNHEATLARRT